jgi:hypothetical protein
LRGAADLDIKIVADDFETGLLGFAFEREAQASADSPETDEGNLNGQGNQ